MFVNFTYTTLSSEYLSFPEATFLWCLGYLKTSFFCFVCGYMWCWQGGGVGQVKLVEKSARTISSPQVLVLDKSCLCVCVSKQFLLSSLNTGEESWLASIFQVITVCSVPTKKTLLLIPHSVDGSLLVKASGTQLHYVELLQKMFQT